MAIKNPPDSIQSRWIFSFKTNKLYGGDEEGRTPDLCIANAALCQLSYIPTRGFEFCHAIAKIANYSISSFSQSSSSRGKLLFAFLTSRDFSNIASRNKSRPTPVNADILTASISPEAFLKISGSRSVRSILLSTRIVGISWASISSKTLFTSTI